MILRGGRGHGSILKLRQTDGKTDRQTNRHGYINTAIDAD